MNEKAKSRNIIAVILFETVFSLAFSNIILQVIFNHSVYSYASLLLCAQLVIVLALFYFLFRWIGKHLAVFARYYLSILCCFAGFFLLLQIYLASLLRYEPAFDLQAIYRNALEWVTTGTFGKQSYPTCDPTYFYYFPNNLGGMAFLSLFFRLARLFGFDDAFMTASIANSLMVICTMCLTSLICKRLFSVRSAVMVLFLFMLSPPFLFAAPVFYTDFLSMIFPLLAFYLFICTKEHTGVARQTLDSLFIALVAAVGMLIKFTAIIVLIALVIYWLCQKNFCRGFLFIISSVIIVSAVSGAFYGYMNTHLDAEQAEQYKTPYSHWIMMGLRGNGDYNGDDYAFTRSFEDPAERKEAIAAEINVRINDLGPGGLLQLWNRKAARCFGDGTFALSDFLDDAPQRQTFLHHFLLYESAGYSLYRQYCTGVFLSVMALMLLSSLRFLWRRDKQISCVFIARLCVFGLMLFLCLWEAKSRYIINFLPMIYIAAVDGLECFFQMLSSQKNRREASSTSAVLHKQKVTFHMPPASSKIYEKGSKQ